MPINPYAYEGLPKRDRAAPPVRRPFGDDVLTHSGRPLPDWMDFPQPPPTEIGPVLSAESDWGCARGRTDSLAIVSAFIIVTLLGYVGLVILLGKLDENLKLNDVVVVLAFLFILIFVPIMATVVLLHSLGRRARIEYVGEAGAALGFYDGKRRCDVMKIFLFADVESLISGYWRGTRLVESRLYDYQLNSAEFFNAIALAWTKAYRRRWEQSFLANGRGTWPLSDVNELIFDGERTELRDEDDRIPLTPTTIVKLALTYDAKLKVFVDPALSPENHGRFEFSLYDVPNADALLHILPKRLGVPLTGHPVSETECNVGVLRLDS